MQGDNFDSAREEMGRDQASRTHPPRTRLKALAEVGLFERRVKAMLLYLSIISASGRRRNPQKPARRGLLKPGAVTRQ
jgi:hypothetical protein